MKSVFTLIALFCLVVISCNQKKSVTSQDVHGVWRVTGDDSSIVVIYSSDFYAHEKDGGDIYLSYLVKGDSFLLSQDNIPISTMKLTLISKDEFFLVDSMFRRRFSRVKSQVDTSRLRALVNWRKGPPYYSQDYFAEYVRKVKEVQDIWDSLSNAGR